MYINNVYKFKIKPALNSKILIYVISKTAKQNIFRYKFL